MKLILLEDVSKLGKKGELVEVKDGYGRNFLLPKKMAKVATKHAINQRDLQAESNQRQREEELEKARELGSQIDQKKVKIKVKSGEEGKLFGSVTSQDISKEIKEQIGNDIKKRNIVLSEPIRTVGEHNVAIKIHPKVTVNLTVAVSELE